MNEYPPESKEWRLRGDVCHEKAEPSNKHLSILAALAPPIKRKVAEAMIDSEKQIPGVNEIEMSSPDKNLVESNPITSHSN